MPAAPVPFFSRRWVIWLALVALPLAAFLPVFDAGFLTWDDYSNVAQNPAMFAPAGGAIREWWTNLDKPYQQLYIPLTYTVWRVISEFARADSALDARVFHAINLLLHIGSTLVVYSILRRLTSKPLPAAVGALIFAIHPVQVESVAWVTGMKDVLSGLLVFAAIYAFERWMEVRASMPTAKRSAVIWYATSTFLFVLSIFAKPSAVMTPMLAALVGFALIFRWERAFLASADRPKRKGGRTVRDFCGDDSALAPSPLYSGERAGVRGKSSLGDRRTPLENAVGPSPPPSPPEYRGRGSQSKSREPTVITRGILFAMLPWLIPALLIGMETHHAQPASHIEHSPAAMRPLIAGDALAFYFRKLAVPINLTPDYGRTPAVAMAGSLFYLQFLIPAGLLFAAIVLRRGMPLILIGLLLFCAALLPVLGFVPFSFQLYSTVADHYLYVAMFGVAMVVATLLDRYWNRTLAVVSAITIVTLGFLSFFQSTHWHDTITLFTRNLSINSRSFVSHSQIAYLAALQDDDATAIAEYREALKIRPEDFFSNFNLANHLLNHGNFAEAAAHYEIALRSRSDEPNLHYNYGVALIRLGRFNAAQVEFETAVSLNDSFAKAEMNLAKVLLIQHRPDQAYVHFQRSLEIDPHLEEARQALESLRTR